GVDRDICVLEAADLLDRKTARDDDADLFEPLGIEGPPDLPDEALVHAVRWEVAHLLPERAVDERLGRVEANAPKPGTELVPHREGRRNGAVAEVDEDAD